MATKIIDLSLRFDDGMRGITFTPDSTIAEKGYNTTMTELYTHAQTHMDAPRHFVEDGNTIDKLPLEKCAGPALVIDLTHKAPASLITVDDLGKAAAHIKAGSRILLRTDWYKKAEDDDYRTHFPRISLELAQWLAEKQIWLVGVETPSVASLRPEHKQELIDVHLALLKANIVIVESLACLDQLPSEVLFVSLPLKLSGLDGSPARPIAMIETDEG